jgi:hypothetical protein
MEENFDDLFAQAMIESDAQTQAAMSTLIIFGVFMAAIAILMIAALWKIYAKAGKPGWAAIVPIYNIIVLLEIVKKPTWWIILYLIPIVNIIVLFIIYIELAKAFGQGAGFGIGLIFLSYIFLPLLAFSKNYQYVYNQPDEVASIGS